jgi:uncharacterized phage protein gp47/JayE
MAFGLTDAGFELKRLADIKAEIESKLRAELGSAINLLPESVFGQLVSIFSERESLVWELAEDVYNSAYPDTASGASLDNVVALTGITRQGATKSKVLGVRLFGTAGTLVPATTGLSVDGNPTAKFETDAAVTLVAGTDEVQNIAFDAVPTAGTWRLNWRGVDTSSLAFNANAAAIQAALQALPFGSGITVSGTYGGGFVVTFAGASGKQEQPLIVVDSNTLVNGVTPVVITITETTPGVNQGVVDVTAIDTGPTQANAGTLTVIDTPVSGLNSVINLVDAVPGRNVETDAELRLRRARTLQVAGKATVDAIRSALLDLEGVTDVIVFENDTEIDDPDGRPPKSFEAIVNGGEDQEIFDKIWDTKPAGIRTVGSEVGTITDSQGQTHQVKFSRPTDVNIWLEVDLSVNSEFPVNGLAASEQALVDMGNSFGIGKDVIVYPKLICALNDIPGIEDVAIRIGTSASPTLDDNIQIDPNEISKFDTVRTTVVTI